MNKKRVLRKVCSVVMLLTLVTSLSSCSLLLEFVNGFINGTLDEIINNSGNEYSSYTLVETPTETIIKDRKEGKSGYNISLLQEKENEGYKILPSLGEQKVLVIPVFFEDYVPATCIDDPNKALDYINDAFFGQDTETGWESVKSYYYESSYGKLDITGQVTSWCPINKKLIEVAEMTSYNDPSIYVLREAIKWVKEKYPGIENEYDLDKDGYIDAVALVYANDYYDLSGNQKYDKKYTNEQLEDLEYLLWAYTYWDYEKEPDFESPVANCYTWLSYDFLWDGEYTKTYIDDGIPKTKKVVDAHTYIHEFGHVLGLDDYYSYDFLDSEPLGRLDMMDNNVGDHNAYSKYLLNWIDPLLVEKEGTYTISTLTKDGNNALLIPADLNSFSYSPFSEYLLLELYTPEGLNRFDSLHRYQGEGSSIPYHFTKNGVKILHVDSRLVVADEASESYYYTNVFNNTLTHPSKIQFIGANNTSSYSINPDFKLVSLISSDKGRNAFDSNYYATNRDLFYKDDMMSEFSFNSGAKLNYNIEIVGIDEKKGTATISITNK